jgi:hypothetical protein
LELSTYSDEFIDHWHPVYTRLNNKHDLYGAHDVSFADFLKDPEFMERWIPIYFDNSHYLARRRSDVAISLKNFLDNGAPLVLLGAQVIDQEEREAVGEELLPGQCRVMNVMDLIDRYSTQEAVDRLFEKNHVVVMRGECLVEIFKHYHPCSKRKVGRALA